MLHTHMFSTNVRRNKLFFQQQVDLFINEMFEVAYECNVRNDGIAQKHFDLYTCQHQC